MTRLVTRLVSRLLDAVEKRLSALKLGVLFGRTQGFTLPTRIRVGRQWYPTQFPNEHGVRVAFLEVLLADCYGLRALPRTLGTVLDIGANVGLFAIAARQRFPDATIHCYEPNPALAGPLRTHAEAAHAVVFMEAVGDTAGHVSLAFGSESVLTRTVGDAAGTIPCAAFADTLERLAPGGASVDLVKLDCEGAEWELLRDAAPWQRVQQLTMEYHLADGQTLAQMRAHVERAGFTVQVVMPADAFGLLVARR